MEIMTVEMKIVKIDHNLSLSSLEKFLKGTIFENVLFFDQSGKQNPGAVFIDDKTIFLHRDWYLVRINNSIAQMSRDRLIKEYGITPQS